MLTPYTDHQSKLIINNVLKAVDNPHALSASGYKYLHLCSGFIAHYDRHGFIGYYSREGNLAEDILRHAKANKWLNFRPGDHNYEYYQSKARIYGIIVQGLLKKGY